MKLTKGHTNKILLLYHLMTYACLYHAVVQVWVKNARTVLEDIWPCRKTFQMLKGKGMKVKENEIKL